MRQKVNHRKGGLRRRTDSTLNRGTYATERAQHRMMIVLFTVLSRNKLRIPLEGTYVQWEVRKDAEKRRRYAPVLDFFNASHKRASWTMSQINFTVGVRGSISTADILERVGQWTHSFVSSLERLGVSRKLDIERTRKAVAKRTFEAHDLMLRSYFAVKFSPSGQVDFSKIRTNSVALQHRIRPRLKTTR